MLEAMNIIESSGIEAHSLREVSRRLEVLHQAPYKHFASRDHILTQIVRRTFEEFAAYIDSRLMTGDPHRDLENLGADTCNMRWRTHYCSGSCSAHRCPTRQNTRR